jgi:hypothetical protein
LITAADIFLKRRLSGLGHAIPFCPLFSQVFSRAVPAELPKKAIPDQLITAADIFLKRGLSGVADSNAVLPVVLASILAGGAGGIALKSDSDLLDAAHIFSSVPSTRSPIFLKYSRGLRRNCPKKRCTVDYNIFLIG